MPTSDVIKLEDVRLSFAHLFKRKQFKADKGNPDKPGKFQATFLLDPSRAAHEKKIEEIKNVAREIMSEQWPKGAKLTGRCFAQNGTHDADGNPVYEGWENMFSIAASEDEQPRVVDIRGVPIGSDGAGAPYSGCYVNAFISLWTQDNDFGKRINANLIAVQFRRDGEAFSGRPRADDLDFEDFSGQAEDPLADGGSDDSDPLAD